MKRSVAVLLALLLVLMTVGPVSADRPEQLLDVDLELIEEVVDCGDFLVLNHLVARWRMTVYFDSEGVPERARFHAHGIDNVFREGYPDHVVTGNHDFHFHMTDYLGTYTDLPGFPPLPDFSTWKQTGVYWNIQLPGHGYVWHGSGQWVFQEVSDYEPVFLIKRAGLDGYDAQTLCAYFAD